MISNTLASVQRHLRLYEHPLVNFCARACDDGIEVVLSPKFTEPKVHTYTYKLHARDLEDPQLEWNLQRQIYDCLHDYLVEMFVRTPQHRKEHAQMEREGKL